MSILDNMSEENRTNTGDERRHFDRTPFHAEILMQCGNEEWTCNLLDVSLKGMLVEPPSNIDIDSNKPCAIALFLGDDVTISARVKIQHVENGHWGLQWLDIDVESLRHLRRILELNLYNPEEINRELAELSH